MISIDYPQDPGTYWSLRAILICIGVWNIDEEGLFSSSDCHFYGTGQGTIFDSLH